MPKSPVVRSGRRDDIPFIKDMTKDTFQWGDYVGDVFPQWLEDPQGDVYVAEMDGRPVGVTHVRYLSPREAWFEGIRVKGDCRRHGIGRILTEASIQGARQRGAQVCRAVIDKDNDKSSGLARGLGFSPVETILEFWRIAWAPSANGCDSAIANACCNGIDPRGSASRDDAISDCPRVTVRMATELDAGPMSEAAMNYMRYAGSDYTWRQLDSRGVALDLAAGANILLAEKIGVPSLGRRVAGGAWLGDIYFERNHMTQTETAHMDMGSVFGEWESVRELLLHVEKTLEKVRDERGLKAHLMRVRCPDTNPAKRILPSLGFTQDKDTIVLWELHL